MIAKSFANLKCLCIGGIEIDIKGLEFLGKYLYLFIFPFY